MRPLLSREEKEQQFFLSIFLLCYVQESVLATKRHSNCYKTNLIKSLWWNLFLSLLLLLPVPSSFFKKILWLAFHAVVEKNNNFAIILVRGKRKTVEKQFNHFLMEFQCFLKSDEQERIFMFLLFFFYLSFHIFFIKTSEWNEDNSCEFFKCFINFILRIHSHSNEL